MVSPSFSHEMIGFGLPLAAQSRVTVCPSTATIFEGGEAMKLGGNVLAACSWSPFIIKLALLLNLYEFKPEALHLK